MTVNEINNLNEKDYIILLPNPDYDIKESVEYSFKNVIFLNYEMSKEEAKIIVDTVNEKNLQLIIFDYDEVYRLILPYIHKKRKIKWIIKNGIASMTDGAVRATFSNLMEFCDRDLITSIGCIDNGAYKVLENAGYNAKRIILDVKNGKLKDNSKSNTIGIIGNDYNPNHNTYNQLTAVKMVDYDYIKIIKNMPATKHFIEFFGIKEKEVESFDEVIKDNFVNLYCCFTATNNEYLLKSMDMGVPCILGNTDIFDENEYLKKLLILCSDDDVNEIADKIKNIKKNYSKIMDEYKKFRKEYTKYSKKSIENFIAD